MHILYYDSINGLLTSVAYIDHMSWTLPSMSILGMEENGSEGLDDVIVAEAKGFFKTTDAVCISDNYWLGDTKPCITYGLRGISYYKVAIKGPGRDLHSGVFGGTVHEPMTDLTYILSKLVTPHGEILIPGIMDDVAPLTGNSTLFLHRK